MIYKSTYQAARAVAETVEMHFAQHLAMAHAAGDEDLAPVPAAKTAELIIDAAFWASLRREEGHSPRISIAFLPPEMAGKPLLFKKRMPLSPATLTKLAPGIERAGIHLGVWQYDDELYIWGTTIKIPNLCFVLDVSEPGLLVIKHRRTYGYGKYTNVAVLKGDQIKVVDEYCASLPDVPFMLTSLLGFNPPSSWNDPVNVLIQLAVSMRMHGHGGTLLVVPEHTDTWRESIIQPMKYAVDPPFCGLTDLISNTNTETSEIWWQSALKREVDNLAGLTAVDGATVISDRYELLAFGAKIGRHEGYPLIEKISVIEPIVGDVTAVVHPGQIGGTRHLSAAQFVHDQHNAVALVASQDGHFTIFTWSAVQNMVQAHRIDTLLL